MKYKPAQGRKALKRLRRAVMKLNLYGKPGGWKRQLRNHSHPWHGGTDCGDAGL